MTMERCYILGPMRGYEFFNFPAFDKVADELRGKGFLPVNPAQIDRDNGFNPFDLPAGYDWNVLPDCLDMQDIIDRDIAALRTCDFYTCLPGWEKSSGASAEKALLDWQGAVRLFGVGTDFRLQEKQQSEPTELVPVNMMDDAQRKALPLYDGAISYFPNALAAVAHHSLTGQLQHGPNKPLQWHREKSQDELGSLSRHILDFAIAEKRGDREGMLEATKAIAWRACAHAERFIAPDPVDPLRYQENRA